MAGQEKQAEKKPADHKADQKQPDEKPEQKTFSSRLKDSMTPWIFKKSEPKPVADANASEPAPAAETVSTHADAPANGEKHPDSGDGKKTDTAAGKMGRIKARLLHRKGEKEKKESE